MNNHLNLNIFLFNIYINHYISNFYLFLLFGQKAPIKMEEYFIEKKYLKENIETQMDLNQKKNFSKFLEFICQSKKINIDQQNNILKSLRDKLIIYLLNNNEYLDEYIIANLVTYQNIQKEIITNTNTLIDFLKLLNFIKIFTININMTSQVMSNCINLINNIIEEFINQSNDFFEIEENIVFPILKLVELNINLSININSYNPRLIIYISRLIDFGLKNIDNNKNDYKKEFSIFYPDINYKSIIFIDFIFNKISQLLNDLNENLKNDINYDIIFKDIYFQLKQNYNKNKFIIKYFTNFLEIYNTIIQNVNLKKQIPMNYLVIKKKAIPCLEPDYDLSFLGDYPEYVNKDEKDKKMGYILKHKTRNTEKQAIRKLKKEARVIDIERQKVIDNINKKRKEDIKFVNQYLEQQNIEYKKMMSSNERKRFKFKKKKNGK